MSEPVGWVVIARDSAATNQISVCGIMDASAIANEAVALELVRTQLPGADQLFGIAAFGMMPEKDAHISKRNLANALHSLGLPALNLDHAYDEIAKYIVKMAREMKHSH